MRILVFLEHTEKDLLKGPLGVLGRAASLGAEEVAGVLVGGEAVSALAAEAGRFGATKVYVAAGEDLDAPLPQPRVDVLERIVTSYGCDAVLFSNSVLAADVAAGLAARLDAGLNWDLIGVAERNGVLVGSRLIFQDSVLVEVGWKSEKKIALFRPGSFDPVSGDAVEPEVERVTVELQDHSQRAHLVSQALPGGGGPSFDDAEVIVAGGMGLGAPENFSLAENLAAVLGGVVGATRAAVYAGWYPRSAQIGQTGRTVAPNLYLALGISGAVQHKVGMQGSKTIVAINTDPNAPIFEVSDLAVVGEVEAIVPRLTELLRRTNGALKVARASDFPAPFQADDYVVEPSDGPDERIDVGVLVVGAGPAGLAFAVRFGQLLSGDPDLAAQLGDVPLAVVEKGKQPGSHLLSGAVLNPRSLQQLFAGRPVLTEIPSYGPVPDESVYVLTRRSALPIPTPPPMRNRGNVIVSLSQFGRWFARQAEEAGAMMLPETAALRLLVSEGEVVGVRSGDKGLGPNGEELSNCEPGSDLVARVTVLAEGTQGHLSGVALQHFGLEGEDPQVWELGVKEVWRVARPLDRVIHTMGWPLRPGAKYREFGGSLIYPMGPDMLTIGMVVGLDYRDASLSVHDLLQELKTHPKVRQLLDGGERIEWGAKTIPGGGLHALPKRLHGPGFLICGDGAGLVNVPTLKGIHYAIESGRLAAEATFAALKRDGQGTGPISDLADYDAQVRSSFIWQDLYEVRDLRQVFGRGFVLGGALAGLMTATKGRVGVGKMRTEPDASQPLLRTDRAAQYPAPDGKLTFDKLSSVFAAGNKTRDDQPDHIRIQHRVSPDVAELWVRTCPAQVYAAGETGPDGLTTVEVAASNCVQCGAITAKGGRLTPPEGGSGPEYTRT